MLIQAFLQLSPSAFAILYHSAIAKNSFKKAKKLSIKFILGAGFFTITLLSIISFIFYVISNFVDLKSPIFDWVLAGILLTESILNLLFYFKKTGTALFISRKTSEKFLLRADKSKKGSDIFRFGISSCIPELLFTLPLYILVAKKIAELGILNGCFLIPIYLLAVVLPLFCVYIYFYSGHNLAEFQRSRTKHKKLIRSILFLGFLILSALIIINLEF